MSVHPDKTAARAVDACGGAYSREEIKSEYAAGHTAGLCEAMKAVGDADALTAELLTALDILQAVFAHDGECSMERFERLAEMFRKETGYLAPGKDAGMMSIQPEGSELRAIYDGWFSAKVQRARNAIANATGDA